MKFFWNRRKETEELESIIREVRSLNCVLEETVKDYRRLTLHFVNKMQNDATLFRDGGRSVLEPLRNCIETLNASDDPEMQRVKEELIHIGNTIDQDVRNTEQWVIELCKCNEDLDRTFYME